MATRTERLYQRDSFLTRFTAAILDARTAPAPDPNASARLAVLLDKTAFYPTGGGQPHDTGRLAGLPVVDVVDSDDGPLHVLELRDAGGRSHGAHVTVGEEVEGVLDWPRRFDHMQQHSGQHILSRAFIESAGARTRSFHLGESFCTIDVEMPRPDEDLIRAAEGRANEIVWSDRAVSVREAPAAPEPAGEPPDPAPAELNLKPGDPVRIIEFEGFDATPCGGTHVSRAGQVGLVGVTAWERFKGMTRVTFVCGGRAAFHLRRSAEALAACVSRLSAPPEGLGRALDRLLVEHQDLQRRAKALARDLAAYEAAALAASAPLVGPYRVLRRVFKASERGVEDALALARRFTGEAGRLAILAVVEQGVATVLLSRSEGEGPRLGEAISEVCRGVGGRGGGAATHARAGGVPEARLAEALDALEARLTARTAAGRA